MKTDNGQRLRSDRVWLTQDRCWVDDFAGLVSCETMLSDYPFASEVASNVLIYDGAAMRAACAGPETRREVLAEWVEALMTGPGVIVLRSMFTDASVVDRATDSFAELIARQRAGNTGGGDHFAKPGANDRVWNALEKLCLLDPEGFALYYGNELLAAVCEAWLGPAYQVTSQINVVNPGGEAQMAHRDYHLGFQSPGAAERYPSHVHRLSPVLTLQGAVAHCDMPLESGPTLYLPYSQRYEAGYLAVTQSPFATLFAERHVQLPLAKGDGVFFNPALFHAAGHNRSADIRRMANLLQVSSAFGRAMESVDRVRMSVALYPALRAMRATGRLDPAMAESAIAACAEGYAFPTNLDRDPPLGGLAPRSQQVLMALALAEDWTSERFANALQSQAERRVA